MSLETTHTLHQLQELHQFRCLHKCMVSFIHTRVLIK